MELSSFNITVCKMSARLFANSARKGYGSKEFYHTLMESEIGGLLYCNDVFDIWISEDYIMETLEAETKISSGKIYGADFLSWLGYFIKGWSLTYPQDNAKDILQQAPFEDVSALYSALHTLSIENAVIRLKELNLQNF